MSIVIRTLSFLSFKYLKAFDQNLFCLKRESIFRDLTDFWFVLYLRQKQNSFKKETKTKTKKREEWRDYEFYLIGQWPREDCRYHNLSDKRPRTKSTTAVSQNFKASLQVDYPSFALTASPQIERFSFSGQPLRGYLPGDTRVLHNDVDAFFIVFLFLNQLEMFQGRDDIGR